MEVTNEPVGQMTIFYSGKVNVFDDISGEKVMKHCIFLLGKRDKNARIIHVTLTEIMTFLTE